MSKQAAETFQDLIVWQKSHELVLSIDRHSERFPKTETHGLTAQIRRAAVSVAANIAEGFRRRKKSTRHDPQHRAASVGRSALLPPSDL